MYTKVYSVSILISTHKRSSDPTEIEKSEKQIADIVVIFSMRFRSSL